jgi:hypothetical protein
LNPFAGVSDSEATLNLNGLQDQRFVDGAGKIFNHEWTRMGTNGHEFFRLLGFV